MDVDRFIAEHGPQWERLGTLTRKAGRRLRSLSAGEQAELVELYQRTSTHLSLASTVHRDPALVRRLTGLVGAAGSVIYATRSRTLRAPLRFFEQTFPAALWTARGALAAAALLFFVPALVVGLWIGSSPAARDVALPPETREAYLNEDFENYYSENPSIVFASQVTTNNVRVGFLAFGAGVVVLPFPGVLTGYLLVSNGASLGVAAGVFAFAGRLGNFLGLILPHGLLELTAVVIAGGAGLRISWAVVAPGDLSRGRALVHEGRRAVSIVLGLVAVFLVAGIIEGFVTGSALPTWARVGIGVIAECAFLTYAVLFGRRAAAAGYSGTIGEDLEQGWAPAADVPAPAA